MKCDLISVILLLNVYMICKMFISLNNLCHFMFNKHPRHEKDVNVCAWGVNDDKSRQKSKKAL